MIDVVRLLKNQESFELQQAKAENRKPRIYHGVFSTHPDNDTRLQQVVKAAHKTGDQPGKPDGREVYLDHIKGLPFGSSEAQGNVRGSRFYHADMGFTLAFPSAWNIDNLPSKVVAFPAQKDAFLELYAMAVPPNVAPREFLAQNLRGVTLASAEPLHVNGLQGYTAVAQSVKLPWGNYGPARFAVVYYNNMAYVFRGATRVGSAMWRLAGGAARCWPSWSGTGSVSSCTRTRKCRPPDGPGKASALCRSMVFTLEPALSLGSGRLVAGGDGWSWRYRGCRPHRTVRAYAGRIP